MSSQHAHLSHAQILLRLKRAEGHLRAVIGMMSEDRSCIDLAQQLHAVEAAIGSAKRELIHDHIENCLEARGEADDGAAAALQELKTITKYL
jgi:DNA-binding FrmR family transcriptional regulator